MGEVDSVKWNLHINLNRFIFSALLSVILSCLFTFTIHAQAMSLADLDAKIATLKREVTSYQTEILQLEKRLFDYQALASKAKQDADNAIDPADVAHYRNSAENFRKLAADRTVDIQNVSIRLNAKRSEMLQLQADQQILTVQQSIDAVEQVSTDAFDSARRYAEEAARIARYHMSLQQATGVWRPVEGGDWPFVIAQAEPGSELYPNRLEVHTEHRVWRGEYVAVERGDPTRLHQARMKFTYTPKASEMNAEIPHWVRAQIAGQLQWEMEIDELGNAAMPLLDVKWYPGEVKWDKSGNIKIVGRGSPKRYRLAQETHIAIEQGSNAAVWVELVETNDERTKEFKRLTNVPPRIDEQVVALLKHQSFTVKARIPAKQAAELGDSLIVSVKTASGETLDLTLLRRTPNGPRPVLFSLDKPIAIADEGTEEDQAPPFASLAWINSKFELKEGRRIRLKVKNQEVVMFSYDGNRYPVLVYDKWYDRAIDQHIATASVAATGYQFRQIMNLGSVREKAETDVALRRITNYALLMQQEDLHDLHKYYLGELYITRGLSGTTNYAFTSADQGIIEQLSQPLYAMSDPNLAALVSNLRYTEGDTQYLTETIKAFHTVLTGGKASSAAQRMADRIPWTSVAEKAMVAGVLQGASHKIEADIQEVVGDIAYSLPKKIAEDISITFKGHDLKGKKKTELDQSLRASFLILQGLLNQTLNVGMRLTASKVSLPPMTAMQRLNNYRHQRIGPPRVYRHHQIKPKKQGPIQRVKLQDPAALKSATRNSLAIAPMERAANLVVKNVPSNVSVKQRRQLQQTLEADPPVGMPFQWQPKQKRPPRAKASGPDDVLDGADLGSLDLGGTRSAKGYDIGMSELDQRALAAEMYGPAIGFVEGQFPIYPRQTKGDCSVHSAVSVIRKGTGQPVTRFEVLQQAVEMERFVLARKAGRAKFLREKAARGETLTPAEIKESEWATLDPEVRSYLENIHKSPHTRTFEAHLRHLEDTGISNVTMRYVLRKYGASVSTVRPSNNHKTRVSMIIDELDKGNSVRVGLDLSDIANEVNAFHIVEVVGYKTLPKDPSIVIEIHFRESNLGGRVLRWPLAYFEAHIARKYADGLPFQHSNFESSSWSQ